MIFTSEIQPLPSAASMSARRVPLGWIIPILLFVAVAAPLTVRSLERLNSDGVCYLHRALLLAGSDFHDAISAYWSPGLIVTTTAMLKVGQKIRLDPLHAIHWTLFGWGLLYTAGAWLFLEGVPGRIAAASVCALVAARLCAPIITPDVLLGAAMLFYLAMCRRRRWLLAGLVAGAGYWCKAYFLPFFLLQFPLTIAWRRFGWRPLLLGFLGFALIAGPWMAVLSIHEGGLTFSTATRRNRFMQDVAPSDVRDHPPDVSAVPPGPFISNMEVTDRDAWPGWSPWDSPAHFAHAIRIAVEHLGDIARDVWALDHVGLVLLAVVLAIGWGDAETRWLTTTGCVYAGGFLFVVYETRYVLPVLLPIGLAITLLTAARIGWKTPALIALMLAPFFISAIWADADLLLEKEPRFTYRQIASQLDSQGLDARFAANTANRDRAACTAYFLGQKFIAMPHELDASALQAKLDERGIRLIFDWFDPEYTKSGDWPEPQTRLLLADGDWIKQLSIHLDSKRRLDVYKRRSTD